jgi:hypothetical protein
MHAAAKRPPRSRAVLRVTVSTAKPRMMPVKAMPMIQGTEANETKSDVGSRQVKTTRPRSVVEMSSLRKMRPSDWLGDGKMARAPAMPL